MNDFQIALLESLEKHQAFSEGSAVLFGAIKDKANLPVTIAEITGCRNAKLIESVKKFDLKYYYLSKKGIKFLDESRPDAQVESSNGQANYASENNEVDDATLTGEGTSQAIDPVVAENVSDFNALADVAGFSMPTTGANYEADLSRENASLRQVIANLEQQKDKLLAAYDSVQEEAQKHATTSTEIHKMLTAYGLPENGLIARVKSLIESHKAITDDLNNALEACRTQSVLTKNLEQNARELNARIAALESHQDLISEEGLLDQIADLELKLASIKSADTFYTVNTGTTVLTFNDEEKAIESAHNEAQRNNTESTVEKICRVKFGVAKTVKSTVWEVF